MNPSPGPARRRLIVLELATVLYLGLLAVWAVRPLLEEWGEFAAYKQFGLNYLAMTYGGMVMRPLHLAGSVIQWLAAGGQPVGVGIIAALAIAARYLVARWAVTPLLAGTDRWLFATVAAVLIGWDGVWLGRFVGAAVASICFFAATGFSLRFALRPSWITAIGTALSILVMLLTYQAVALAALFIPAVLIISSDGPTRERLKQAGLACAALALGAALYGAYVLFALHFVGPGNYESGLLRGALTDGTAYWPLQHVATAYMTALTANGLVPAIYGLLLAVVAQGALARRRTAFVTLLFACLPLTALAYVIIGHLRDPERTMLPVAVAFVLLLLPAARAALAGGRRLGAGVAGVAVVALLGASTLSGLRVWQLWQVEKQVLLEAMPLVAAAHPRTLLIRDTTGQLGDVYSFLDTVLTAALTYYDLPVTAKICTPLGVDRQHAIARRYPIQTTPRCEDVDAGRYDLVLTASLAGGRMTLAPRS